MSSLRARLGVSAALVIAAVVGLSTYLQARIVARAVEAEALDAAAAIALGVSADLGEHRTAPSTPDLVDLLGDYRKAVPAVQSITITAAAPATILASTDAAARALAALGIAVDEGPLPFDIAPVVEMWPVLGQVGAAYVAGLFPGRDDEIGPRLRAQAEAGRAIPATRYLDVIESLDVFRRNVTAAFAGVDLIMTPSAAALPWPADDPFPTVIDGQSVGPRGHAVFTAWVNACGHPALALPSAPSPAGLPIGFQLVGPLGADDLLLELGRQFESAQPWRDRWPPLAEG